MELAFFHYHRRQDDFAQDAFRAAIATGNLNTAGKTLAYWHIFVANRNLGEVDAAADALMSFIMVAQDAIDTLERNAPRGGHGGAQDDVNFVERFDLRRRLAHARAILWATWAERSEFFGRSSDQPVRIHDLVEMDYFLELAPPCTGEVERHVSVTSMPSFDGTPMERATISCQEGALSEVYYFDFVAGGTKF